MVLLLSLLLLLLSNTLYFFAKYMTHTMQYTIFYLIIVLNELKSMVHLERKLCRNQNDLKWWRPKHTKYGIWLSAPIILVRFFFCIFLLARILLLDAHCFGLLDAYTHTHTIRQEPTHSNIRLKHVADIFGVRYCYYTHIIWSKTKCISNRPKRDGKRFHLSTGHVQHGQ